MTGTSAGSTLKTGLIRQSRRDCNTIKITHYRHTVQYRTVDTHLLLKKQHPSLPNTKQSSLKLPSEPEVDALLAHINVGLAVEGIAPVQLAQQVFEPL